MSSCCPHFDFFLPRSSSTLNCICCVKLQVAYLSLTSWRDSQVENQDRQRSRPSDKSAVGKPEAWITSGGGNQASKKNPQKARTDKGFGRK